MGMTDTIVDFSEDMEIKLRTREEIEKYLDKTKYEKMFIEKLNKEYGIKQSNLKEDLKIQKLKLKNNINTLKTELNILKE